jgi:addiction module RelE/StbE family toxin
VARRLSWSERALDDLDEILAHIAQDAPRNASMVHDRIIARLDSLPDQPGQGRRVPGLGATYREVIVQSWRIFYRTSDTEVLIVAVVHSARLLRNVPPF